ncbi:glutathione synthetase ATP-binding domain-like protein [Pleomassaria siparia CBS 279.74]|uniref:Glutathione synthetase ATP-binding domain-like protein n=1 Tax=Pleomassaria siparia CBS 279.74 TaxID=1314801 RepID=A0A6G1KLR3_9PLEO|nr:glutathione synthetase ATP-binding domain-like protein [Pleomassaria siparia CBS 279.74]
MDATTKGEGDYVIEDFLVKIFDTQAPASTRVSCRWRKSKSPADEETSQYFSSLDLLLRLLPLSTHRDDTAKYPYIPDASGTALETLVRRLWTLNQSLANGTEVVIKVILAPHSGFVCRSDILDLRMRHSEYIDAIISFSTWDTYLLSLPVQDKDNLLPLLLSSPGALCVKPSRSSSDDALRLLQKDLQVRLSFNWILPIKPTASRVAVVGGRPMPDPKSGMYGSRGFFEAAQALGISLIVFDEPGHWLESEKYAHLREDFIPMDMSDLKELPQKLADATRETRLHIDGIVTFMDEYVVTTSQAAELLGLPTEPARKMLQAHYKHEMRNVVHEVNIQAVTLDNVEQLDDPSLIETLGALRYPLVVKPCRGMTSKGIKKVLDEASMRQAVRMLEEDEDVSAEYGILLETYVDGPEFDANFVLWEGQILFLEVTDNFPCRADASGSTLADNFAETVQISNTRLPADEVDIIRSSLLRSLVKLGFSSGVFHCEGRMMNSSMRYADVGGNGILDLVANDSRTADQQPAVFLIEVNVRPPGTGGTWATLLTYGVDLGALQFLRALNDRCRFEALSSPYSYPSSSSSPGDGGGAQWWLSHCMVPIHRDKIRVPENFFEKLYAILPEIMPHVARAEMYASPGTVVSPVAGIGWIAYLLLFSRTSRAHALGMYHRVSETAKKVLDTSNYDSGYES